MRFALLYVALRRFFGSGEACSWIAASWTRCSTPPSTMMPSTARTLRRRGPRDEDNEAWRSRHGRRRRGWLGEMLDFN